MINISPTQKTQCPLNVMTLFSTSYEQMRDCLKAQREEKATCLWLFVPFFFPSALHKPNIFHLGTTQIVEGGMKVVASIFFRRSIFLHLKLAIAQQRQLPKHLYRVKNCICRCARCTETAPSRGTQQGGKGESQNMLIFLLLLLFKIVVFSREHHAFNISSILWKENICSLCLTLRW